MLEIRPRGFECEQVAVEGIKVGQFRISYSVKLGPSHTADFPARKHEFAHTLLDFLLPSNFLFCQIELMGELFSLDPKALIF